MSGNTAEVFAALRAQGHDVIRGKGGFWIRGKGFISLSQARKLTGIVAPKRTARKVSAPWGDWATVVALNTQGRTP